jgi:hypothetical protein
MLLILLPFVALYWLTMGRERRRWLTALVTALVVVGLTVGRVVQYENNPYHGDEDEVIFQSILFFVGLGGMVMAGWSSWGRTGWKAWLQWRAVIWTGVMAAGMSPAINGDTLLMFFLGLVPFAVGAAICGAETGSGRPSVAGTPMGGGAASAGQGDRERVLGLLERGAITGDEAAELLAALGEKSAGAALGLLGQRMLWVGATLVVMGFFLPWANIDVGKMMEDMQAGLMQGMPTQGWVGQMQTTSSMTVNGVPAPPGYTSSGVPMAPPGYPMGSGSSGDGLNVTVHAGDLAHGIGWVILAVAVAAAALPQFREFRRKPAETRRMVLAALVGVGLLLSLYVGSGLIKYAQAGLVLDIAGYLLMTVAVAREFRAAAGANN